MKKFHFIMLGVMLALVVPGIFYRLVWLTELTEAEAFIKLWQLWVAVLILGSFILLGLHRK